MREGEVCSPSPGETLTCIQSGSAGGPFIFEMELGPGVKGPPMHSHDEGDETIEVLAGHIVFRVGRENKQLGPGESLTLRPDQPHTFWNPSKTEPVHCRVIHGARFEKAIAQPDFLSLAMYLSLVDPGASRPAHPLGRVILRIIAAFGQLRGKKPIVTGERGQSAT